MIHQLVDIKNYLLALIKVIFHPDYGKVISVVTRLAHHSRVLEPRVRHDDILDFRWRYVVIPTSDDILQFIDNENFSIIVVITKVPRDEPSLKQCLRVIHAIEEMPCDQRTEIPSWSKA